MKRLSTTPTILLASALTAILVAALACSQSAPETGPPGPEQTPLWVAGEGGYHTYRIPALLTTQQGSLLAFC